MITEAELIAAIVAEPGSTQPWDVYADWLIDRGDPRGEWIRAEMAGQPNAAIDEARLMSPRLAAQRRHVTLRWWRSFISAAGLAAPPDGRPTADTIAALFADPHSALLAELSLVHPITSTVPLWQAVFAEPRPSVTDLVAGNLGLHDGGAQLAALPNLARLELVEPLQAQRVTVPVQVLVHSELRGVRTGARECPALAEGRFELPRLVHLDWHLIDGIADGRTLFTHASSLLHRPPPALCELTIRDRFDRASIAVLATCAALPQLRRLVWHTGFRSMATLLTVLEHAAAFRHLDELVVRGLAVPHSFDLAPVRARLDAELPSTKVEVGGN